MLRNLASPVLTPPTPEIVKRQEVTAKIAPPYRWGAAVLVTIAACAGVLCVAEADIRSRQNAPDGYELFWLGLALIVVPVAWRLCRINTGRSERLVLAVLVGMCLYLVKCLYSPIAFVFSDEFAHVRTVIDLQHTGQLFGFDPRLLVAPDYPGLAVVTLGLMKVSGLSVVTSGMVVIGAARLLLMLSVFLLLERLTSSARAAGLGTLIYAGDPNFLYWSAQFAYESLALPLALAVLYLIVRRSDGDRKELILALLVGAMVVVTHHIAAYALVVALAAWSVAAALRRRQSRRPAHAATTDRDRANSEYVPVVPTLLIALASVLWLALAAPSTIGYLYPVVDVIAVQAIDLVVHHQRGKQLFVNSGGPVEPAWQRVVALGSVIAVLVSVPLGLLRRWWKNEHPLASVLAWGAIIYLILLPLAVTSEGQEALVRSSEYLYVGIGLLMAIVLTRAPLRGPRDRSRSLLSRIRYPKRTLRTGNALLVVLLVVCGGFALAWSFAKILSPPPQAAGPPSVPIPDDVAAARWLFTTYGPNHRIATDETTGLAFDTDGDQNVLSGAADGSHIWRIFFPTTMSQGVYGELRASDVQFIVIQKRLTEGNPPPYAIPFYDTGEPGNDDLHAVPVASEDKFVGARGITMVYRSGTITIYRVDQSVVDHVRAAPSTVPKTPAPTTAERT